jgi:multidrug resistance protein, MATE family
MMPNSEVATLLRLALPAVATQVGIMLLGVVDTIMVGHVGVEALAAVSVGHAWVMTTLLFGLGVVVGMEPLVSQAHGAGRPEPVGRALQSGLLVSLGVSVVVGGLWLLTEPVLVLLGQEPELARRAHGYVLVQVPTVPFFYASQALRMYLQGRTLVTPTMWVMVPANLLNALFNWVLIFGHWGVPALGLTGAGIATGLSRASVFVLLLAWIVVFRLHEGAWAPWSRRAFTLRSIAPVLALGLPLGVQFALEAAAFNATAIMAGWIGATALAANTVVLNMASLTFMMPLGVSIAAATRVGNLVGAGDVSGARRTVRVALALGVLLMTLAALGFVVLRRWIPRAYTDDLGVVALAASALPVAAAFQIFDGTQVVSAAILRGMGRTRIAAFANLLGYYALALPFGAWLAFERGLGLTGIWWGMCLGLATVAAVLLVRVRQVRDRPIRLHDAPPRDGTG